MGSYKFLRLDKRVSKIEVRDMILKYDRDDMRAITAILWITGARISEILLMRKEDIKEGDNNTMELTITTLKKPRRRRVKTKTGKFRKNKKGEFVWKMAGKKAILESRNIILNKDTPFLDIFLNYTKGKEDKLFEIKRCSVNWHMKKVNHNISPHIFRHSRLQQIADKGATSHQIRSFAGHKNIIHSQPYVEASKQLLTPIKDMIN